MRVPASANEESEGRGKVMQKSEIGEIRKVKTSEKSEPLYRHTVRQLLLNVTKLINKRAESGRATRFIKLRAHTGELHEGADAWPQYPVRSLAMDQDTQVVYFLCTRTNFIE